VSPSGNADPAAGIGREWDAALGAARYRQAGVSGVGEALGFDLSRLESRSHKKRAGAEDRSRPA
jgi:hypothetical protein